MRAGESKAVMNEEQERSVRGRIGEIGGLVEWVGGRESRRQTDTEYWPPFHVPTAL